MTKGVLENSNDWGTRAVINTPHHPPFKLLTRLSYRIACRSSSSISASTTREESFHSIAIVTLGLRKEGLKILGMLSCLRISNEGKFGNEVASPSRCLAQVQMPWKIRMDACFP